MRAAQRLGLATTTPNPFWEVQCHTCVLAQPFNDCCSECPFPRGVQGTHLPPTQHCCRCRRRRRLPLMQTRVEDVTKQHPAAARSGSVVAVLAAAAATAVEFSLWQGRAGTPFNIRSRALDRMDSGEVGELPRGSSSSPCWTTTTCHTHLALCRACEGGRQDCAEPHATLVGLVLIQLLLPFSCLAAVSENMHLHCERKSRFHFAGCTHLTAHLWSAAVHIALATPCCKGAIQSAVPACDKLAKYGGDNAPLQTFHFLAICQFLEMSQWQPGCRGFSRSNTGPLLPNFSHRDSTTIRHGTCALVPGLGCGQ